MSVDDLRVECARLGLELEGPYTEMSERRRSTPAELDRFEAKLTYPLPADFRFFLENHNLGRSAARVRRIAIPVGRTAETMQFAQRDVEIYTFMRGDVCTAQDIYGEPLLDIDSGGGRQWWTLLAPVTERDVSYILALDYRFDPVCPPVISVDMDINNPHGQVVFDLNWLDYVAPSFTAMLQQGVSLDGDETMSGPCPYGDQVIAWRQSTITYLSEHVTAEIEPRIGW